MVYNYNTSLQWSTITMLLYNGLQLQCYSTMNDLQLQCYSTMVYNYNVTVQCSTITILLLQLVKIGFNTDYNLS
jgi:hypothetical protein